MAPAIAGIALRMARENDAADLARLSNQLGYPITPEAAESRLRDVLGGPDHALIVAESRGRVAGWMELRRVRLFANWRQIEVVALVVDEHERERGIGSRLLEEAERWAADLRCGKIRLRSNTTRGQAHSLYRRLGYEEISTGILFEKQLGTVRPRAAKFVPTSIASKGGGESPLSTLRNAVAALLKRAMRRRSKKA